VVCLPTGPPVILARLSGRMGGIEASQGNESGTTIGRNAKPRTNHSLRFDVVPKAGRCFPFLSFLLNIFHSFFSFELIPSFFFFFFASLEVEEGKVPRSLFTSDSSYRMAVMMMDYGTVWVVHLRKGGGWKKWWWWWWSL